MFHYILPPGRGQINEVHNTSIISMLHNTNSDAINSFGIFFGNIIDILNPRNIITDVSNESGQEDEHSEDRYTDERDTPHPELGTASPLRPLAPDRVSTGVWQRHPEADGRFKT